MRDPDFHEYDPDLYDDPHAPAGPKPNLWQRLIVATEMVLYVLIIFGILQAFLPEIEKEQDLDVRLAQIESVQTEKEMQVSELRGQFELLKSDREYLESVARDRLDLAREDEFVVRIERPGSKEAEPDGGGVHLLPPLQ